MLTNLFFYGQPTVVRKILFKLFFKYYKYFIKRKNNTEFGVFKSFQNVMHLNCSKGNIFPENYLFFFFTVNLNFLHVI